MWEKLFSAIEQIKEKYGEDVIKDAKLAKGLLTDFVPDATNEIRALVGVLEDQSVVKRLISKNDVTLEYLTNRIEGERGLSHTWAEGIAYGLMVLSGIPAKKPDMSPKKPPEPPKKAPEPVKPKTKTNEEIAAEHAVKGNTALLAGNFVTAKAEFDKALTVNPNHAGARVGKMLTGFRLKNLDALRNSTYRVKGNYDWELAKKHATSEFLKTLSDIEISNTTFNEVKAYMNTVQKPPPAPTPTPTPRPVRKRFSFFRLILTLIGIVHLLAAFLFTLDWVINPDGGRVGTFVYIANMVLVSVIGGFFTERHPFRYFGENFKNWGIWYPVVCIAVSYGVKFLIMVVDYIF